MDFLLNITSYLNPFHENFFGNTLKNLFSTLLQNLFIPSTNPFEDLALKINEKFGFINQIKEFITNFLGFKDFGTEPPVFEINYKGTKLKIIDFSIFLQYRTFLHSIILAIAWTLFIFRLYKRIPNIIGGLTWLQSLF